MRSHGAGAVSLPPPRGFHICLSVDQKHSRDVRSTATKSVVERKLRVSGISGAEAKRLSLTDFAPCRICEFGRPWILVAL